MGHRPCLNRVVVPTMLLLVSCGRGPAVDNSLQVDTVGTTVFVRNPAPARQDTLTPILEIGRVAVLDTKAPDEFGRINAAVLDALGRVFVADGQALQIRMFLASGTFTRALGRSGQGPGEFGALYSLGFMGDSLLALDSRNARISLFSPSGQPLATWRWLPMTGPVNVVRFYPTGARESYVRGLLTTPGGRGSAYIRLMSHGPAGTISDPLPKGLPNTTIVCPIPGGMTFFSIPFAATRISVPAPNGQLASAWSADYRITFTTAEGDTVRVIERAYTHLPVTSVQWLTATEDYRDFRKQVPGAKCNGDMTRPPHRAALQGIYFDQKGHLVVEVTADSAVRYDFYDKEGRARQTVHLPQRDASVAPYFRGDRIVQVARDSLDIQYVQIFETRTGR